MGRIRTVKPELFGHEELFDLERESGLPVRLAFIGLFTCCDREGRFKWRPRTLKKDVLPHDDVDFSRVLDALGTRGFVRKYVVDGEFYGEIPTWDKHQVINNRESNSDIPAPMENDYISTTCTREARVDDASSTRGQTRQGEGKGREGKGREGNNPHVELAPDVSDEQPERRTVVLEAIDNGMPLALVKQKAAASRNDVGEEVRAVFAYWQREMCHPRAQLDAKREKAIKTRLRDGYSVDDLCRAVDGCRKSPHHMGQNDTRTVYDDIELICRDAPRVDKFVKLAGLIPGGMSPGLTEQVGILDDWMRGE